jgi:ribosomal protein L14
MVVKGTQIGILDNTGIRRVKVLQVYRHRCACVGDILLSVIRKKKRVKKYVKRKIHYVFLVTRKAPLFRSRGFYYVRLLRNAGLVLVPDREKILGTRHRGFLTLESRRRAFVQLIRSVRLIV